MSKKEDVLFCLGKADVYIDSVQDKNAKQALEQLKQAIHALL